MLCCSDRAVRASAPFVMGLPSGGEPACVCVTGTQATGNLPLKDVRAICTRYGQHYNTGSMPSQFAQTGSTSTLTPSV